MLEFVQVATIVTNSAILMVGVGALLLALIAANYSHSRKQRPADERKPEERLAISWLVAAAIAFGIWLTFAFPVIHRLRTPSALPPLPIVSERDAADTNLPAWVRNGSHREGDNTFLVLESYRHPQVNETTEKTVSLAKVEVLKEAEQQIRLAMRNMHAGETSEFEIPTEFIEERAIVYRHVEYTEIDFGDSLGVRPVYRMHILLKITPELLADIYPAWRKTQSAVTLPVFQSFFMMLGSVVISVTIFYQCKPKMSKRVALIVMIACWVLILTSAGLSLKLLPTLDTLN